MDKVTVLKELAGYLETKREALLAQFVAAIRVQPAMTTADENQWDREAIQDQISRLIDNLLAELRNPGDPKPVENSVESALAHGAHRWEQHYHQAELIREFSLFREVLMFHIAQFEETFPRIDMQTRVDVEFVIHRFLDQLMIEGATRFASLVAEAPDREAGN